MRLIFEFFQSLLSDAPKWAIKQKLVNESIAIKARHERQKSHWANHLIGSQSEILKFINEFPHSKEIAVFGSGHLFDFPTELFSRKDLEFFLFDAVHPKSVRRQSYAAKVHFLNADLNLKPEVLKQQFAEAFGKCDLFISLNLLSQLALGGSAHLSKSEHLRKTFAQTLVSNHLALLKNRKTLLISDFEKNIYDREDKNILFDSTLWDYKMPQPIRKWEWDLAPFGEVSKKYRIELTVGLWRFN